ncbi:MAG TPA: CBS domain-containing protein [Kofleriaceae bacterium]|jgi:CBS domain-containing protein|nr:CBS domain-containing protein [Kofleriaceae bacterium]
MRRLEKTIREIGWTHAVPRLDVGERVSCAFDEMSREVHDCVLVMKGRALAGIFTSRDFLNRIAAVRADPGALVLGDVMTPMPCTLRPRDPVAFAINWMAVEGFRNVPIVDDDGEVLGVLTVWDVMRHLEAIFDEIDATPRPTPATGDTSSVIQLFDLGGGS